MQRYTFPLKLNSFKDRSVEYVLVVGAMSLRLATVGRTTRVLNNLPYIIIIILRSVTGRGGGVE